MSVCYWKTLEITSMDGRVGSVRLFSNIIGVDPLDRMIGVAWDDLEIEKRADRIAKNHGAKLKSFRLYEDRAGWDFGRGFQWRTEGGQE